MGKITVDVTVEDRSGNRAVQSVDVQTQDSVRGGYYLGSGADISTDIQGMNCRSHTTYRSFADGSIFPGYNKQWIINLGNAGVAMNYVLELKHYGAANTNPQTFNALGQSWMVPSPAMTIQQRSGTTFPRAYGYNQVMAGQCDGLFARALQQLRTLPFPVNIQLASELDTDHEFGTTEGSTAYTWAQSDGRAVEAMSYIIDWLKARGVPAGTTFSVGIGGFDQACFVRTHPESLMAKVDYIQWNAYATSASHTALDRFKRPRDWTNASLGPIAQSKPIIIAEWGVRVAEVPNQSGYILTVPAAINQINSTPGGKIVMANYFNSGWGTLNPKSAGIAALKTAYSEPPFS